MFVSLLSINDSLQASLMDTVTSGEVSYSSKTRQHDDPRLDEMQCNNWSTFKHLVAPITSLEDLDPVLV